MLQKSIYIFLLLISISDIAFSQSYTASAQSLSAEKGLANQTIQNLFKDSQGFLWISTANGLTRYDGHKTINLYEKDGLLTNNIKQIGEDKKGSLWILNSDNILGPSNPVGISVLNTSSLKAMSVQNYVRDSLPFLISTVTFITSDSKRNIWVSTNRGEIYKWDGTKFSFYWQVPTQKAIYWFSVHKAFFHIFLQKEHLKLVNKKLLWQLMLDSREKNRRNPTWNRKSISIHNNKEIWVGDSLWHTLENDFLKYHNLVGINVEGGYLIIYSKEKPKLLLFLDRQGNVIQELEMDEEIRSAELGIQEKNLNWVVTPDKIYTIRLRRNAFQKILHNYEASSESSQFATRGIWVNESTHELYVSGIGPFLKVNLDNNSVNEINLNSVISKNGLAITHSVVDNSIWFGTESPLIIKHKLLAKTSKSYRYRDMNEILKGPESLDFSAEPSMNWSLYVDKNETTWIGHGKGLSYLSKNQQEIQFFKKYNQFSLLKGNSVYYFHPTGNGAWLATTQGLFLLDSEEGIVDRWHLKGEIGKRIPHNVIAHIHEDKAGSLWLASKGGGLIHLDLETGNFEQFTTEQGLSHNTIYAVYPDNFGNLWLSSDNGIMRFNKQTHEVSIYQENTGITDNEFNTISHYQTTDGRIYFGGLNGITAFHPQNFHADSITSTPVRMTSVEKQTKEGKFIDARSSFDESNQLILNPSDLGLQISFSLLQFTELENTVYAYKIEGLDANWNYLAEPKLRLNGLPYGAFIITVKAQNDLGNWSEDLEIPVYIEKPFYLRTWFLILSALLIGFFLWIAWKQRVRGILERQDYLEALIEERTTELRLRNLKKQMLLKRIFSPIYPMNYVLHSHSLFPHSNIS